MSKAFTSEETPELEPASRAPPRVRPGEVRYVTPEGHAALGAELSRVQAALAGAGERPEAERAAIVVDLERRAALLQGTLAALTVLGPDAAAGDRAAFATWVTVEDAQGRRATWRLVGPDEADPRRGLISVHAPVGRALLGREPGDAVEVERPDGRREYTVVAVRRTPP
jgi:transcription elongation factor GreB